MKKMIIALAIVLGLAFVMVTIHTAQAAGPDTITLAAAKKGPVTLNHKAHQAAGKCTDCHEGAAGGKIATKGMAWGHKTCKDSCHKTQGKGPQACADCHK